MTWCQETKPVCFRTILEVVMNETDLVCARYWLEVIVSLSGYTGILWWVRDGRYWDLEWLRSPCKVFDRVKPRCYIDYIHAQVSKASAYAISCELSVDLVSRNRLCQNIAPANMTKRTGVQFKILRREVTFGNISAQIDWTRMRFT